MVFVFLYGDKMVYVLVNTIALVHFCYMLIPHLKRICSNKMSIFKMVLVKLLLLLFILLSIDNLNLRWEENTISVSVKKYLNSKSDVKDPSFDHPIKHLELLILFI
jgi:hypothetical protein